MSCVRSQSVPACGVSRWLWVEFKQGGQILPLWGALLELPDFSARNRFSLVVSTGHVRTCRGKCPGKPGFYYSAA